MSPEQIAQRPTSAASDWYNAGVMLYEALTGRLPFKGNLVDILVKKQSIEPPPPRELAPEIPKTSARYVRTCSAYDLSPGLREVK